MGQVWGAPNEVQKNKLAVPVASHYHHPRQLFQARNLVFLVFCPSSTCVSIISNTRLIVLLAHQTPTAETWQHCGPSSWYGPGLGATQKEAS